MTLSIVSVVLQCFLLILLKIRTQSFSIIVLVSSKLRCFHCEYEPMKSWRLASRVVVPREGSVDRRGD